MPDSTIFEQVLAAARPHGVTEIEVILSTENQALTRFANNVIHQNVAEQTTHLSVRPIIDGRTARASTNCLDRYGIRNVVAEAVAITRVTEPDRDLLPLAEPALTDPVDRWFQPTAQATPEERARAVADAIRAQPYTAAGAYSTGESTLAIFNSRGVALEYRESMARFSITSMAPGSSGWAKSSGCDHRTLSPVDLARRAAEKATRSQAPRELPAGRYTVILEPPAVLDLAGQMAADFSATPLRDGRSFLQDRIGKKLFGDNISIYDDVYHPGQAGAPFDAEGVPRERLTLVDRGHVRDIAVSRQAAALSGAKPTGHGFPLPNELGEAPMNLVFAGGSTSVDEMIATAERAILVTRLWYIREVDPYEKIFTGMTRDGTFLVEDGRIIAGVRNFRFNQSLIEMLSNVVQLSPGERTSGEEIFDMVVPAMKITNFNLT